ncbi:response regulator transcription factor [Rubidibacter lacunae]|uniref:response regulator transcription factor n=1 Tax=Rubidibacter lacunae TaxID=582514 RepID=UPI0004043D47|nr:helix-turn-helix transcriptional regulator [Rubidibacter lacunae]
MLDFRGRTYRLFAANASPAPSATVGSLQLDGRRFWVASIEPHQPVPNIIAKLTARERSITALVAQGLSNEQIARYLGISKWTVSTHLRRAFTKLGVDSRAALVYRCASQLTPPENRVSSGENATSSDLAQAATQGPTQEETY